MLLVLGCAACVIEARGGVGSCATGVFLQRDILSVGLVIGSITVGDGVGTCVAVLNMSAKILRACR